MTRDEWNALVARYTAALTLRVNVHDPALLPARDLAVADALLAVLDGERRLRATEWVDDVERHVVDLRLCSACCASETCPCPDEGPFDDCGYVPPETP